MKNSKLVASPRLHFIQGFGVFILKSSDWQSLPPFFGTLPHVTGWEERAVRPWARHCSPDLTNDFFLESKYTAQRPRSLLILRHPLVITAPQHPSSPIDLTPNVLRIAFRHACSPASQLEFSLEKRHIGLYEVIKPGSEIHGFLLKHYFL